MKLYIEIPTGVGSHGNGHAAAFKAQPAFDPDATATVLEPVVPWREWPEGTRPGPARPQWMESAETVQALNFG